MVDSQEFSKNVRNWSTWLGRLEHLTTHSTEQGYLPFTKTQALKEKLFQKNSC